MRSGQDRRRTAGGRRHGSPQDDNGRFGDEESPEGQYEKDPWRSDWRRDPPYAPFEPGHPRREGQPFGAREAYGRSEHRYPPGPKGYQRSDERLREDISERLMQARYLDSSEVTVEVSGAKVVLDGTVPERRMKHAIEDLVDACPGVQDIDNRIRVTR